VKVYIVDEVDCRVARVARALSSTSISRTIDITSFGIGHVHSDRRILGEVAGPGSAVQVCGISGSDMVVLLL
jgi:hypothetical protein